MATSEQLSSMQLIACHVFQDALTQLDLRQYIPALSVTYLPAYLHLYPHKLGGRLESTLKQLLQKDNKIACMYGQCFPEIDEVLHQHGVPRFSCTHCYEAFLGRNRFQALTETYPGTFFLEKELLTHFQELCAGPLELDDPEMRAWFFEHYTLLVYIRQPNDPDLAERAAEIAAWLNLELRVMDADYDLLKKNLFALLQTE